MQAGDDTDHTFYVQDRNVDERDHILKGNLLMKRVCHSKGSFQGKVSWFFTGYAETPAEKILYFIKRLVWLCLLVSSIRFLIEFFIGIAAGNGLTALSLLIPAGVSAAVALLFFRFD